MPKIEKDYREFGFVDSLAAQMSSKFESKPSEPIDIDKMQIDKTMKVENDPSFELAETERQRNMLLARLKGHTEFVNTRKKVSIKTQKDFDEDTKSITVNLMERMHEACMKDYECIKNDQQAMHRFKMIEEISELLRKKHIQELFLDMQGCRFLEMWISQNPDSSYPPIQIIECVLRILDNMPITQEHLESSQVARAVTQYAAGGDLESEKLPAELVSNATKLLQKWQTVVYQLSYEYDQDGMHEIKQRDLRRRLEVLRDLDQLGGVEKAKILNREDDLIRKTPNGFIF